MELKLALKPGKRGKSDYEQWRPPAGLHETLSFVCRGRTQDGKIGRKSFLDEG